MFTCVNEFCFVRRFVTIAYGFRHCFARCLICLLLGFTCPAFADVVFCGAFRNDFERLRVFFFGTINFRFFKSGVPTDCFCFFFYSVSTSLCRLRAIRRDEESNTRVIYHDSRRCFERIMVCVRVIVIRDIILFKVGRFRRDKAKVSTIIATRFICFIRGSGQVEKLNFCRAFSSATQRNASVDFAVTASLNFIVRAAR